MLISAVSYVTRDIHHILQGLKKLSTYVVQVSAVLDDGGETDVSEVEFETGKLIFTIPDHKKSGHFHRKLKDHFLKHFAK